MLTTLGVRLPEAYPDQQTPFLTNVKGLATYTIPKIDLHVAGTLQSRPFVGTNFPSIASQSLAANWVVSNALVTPELGRSLSGNAQTTIVNLVAPGDLYGDRINQVDFRLGKILRYGRTRANIGLDIFNLFNASPVTTYNQSFVPPPASNPSLPVGYNWLQPAAIIGARIAKVSVQVDF